LKLALDVAVTVGGLVVVDLLAAGCFHSGTSETRGWGGDAAVAGDGGEEARWGGEHRGSVLHVEGWKVSAWEVEGWLGLSKLLKEEASRSYCPTLMDWME
jgi:hypothetical protein